MKIFLDIFFGLLLIFSLICSGFSFGYKFAESDERVGTIEYEGHRYFYIYKEGKYTITHDSDCPCHTKGGDK